MMKKIVLQRFALCALVCFLPLAASAQDDRGAMTINASGDVLRFIADTDNEPTAVLESSGDTTEILAYGDTLQGEDVYGFGNIADLNDAGVAVMKVVTEENGARGINDDDLNQFLVTANSAGATTVIAVATRDGVGSTAFGDSVLCNIGPMPENNNAGQVAWFGALTPSADPSDECEDVDRFFDGVRAFAFNQGFIEDHCCNNDYFEFETLVGGIGGETEADLSVNDDVTGSYVFLGGENESSAVFRYTPGPGHEILLEGAVDGSKDSLPVSEPRFVDSPTTFDVLEVNFIRDGSRRFNASADVIAHTEVSAEGVLGDTTFENCTAEVAQITDNPNDDPADDMPYVGYRDIDCPGGPDQGTVLEEALVLFRGSTRTVVALTGPESVYSEIEDEGAVINDRGQVLFRAELQDEQVVRGSGLAVLELYTPGVGWTTIAMEGDPLPTPGSALFFCDFAPHYELANDGSLAFQAEIGDCGDDPERGGDGDTGMFHYANGQIRELFRTDDMAEVGVDVPSMWQGNTIDELSSVAIVPTSGLVQFYVESSDFEPDACNEVRGGSFGGGEWTALVSWTEENGLETVMAEGDPIGEGDGVIHRIYAMGPKLRAQANASAEMVALIDIDQDGDCDVDENDEKIDETEVVVIGRGTPPTGSVLEIPVGGPLGLGIFATALVLLSMMWVRSRAVGV